MTATPYVCGAIRTSQGRAPTGWLRVARAGDDSGARWYCREECLVEALTGRDPEDRDVRDGARALATAAGRPWLRFDHLTPVRLRALISAVGAQADVDAEGHRYATTDAAKIL